MNLNRFIFPAPPSSYTASTLKKNLIWIERMKTSAPNITSPPPSATENNGKPEENKDKPQAKDRFAYKKASTVFTETDLSKELYMSNSKQNLTKKGVSSPVRQDSIYIELEKEEKPRSAHSSPRTSLQDLVVKEEGEHKENQKEKKKKLGCFEFFNRHKENRGPVNEEDQVKLNRNEGMSIKSHIKKSVVCGGGSRPGKQTVKIPCFYFTAKCETKRTLLFFHSNGEDIFLTSELLKFLSEYLLVNILAVEYPGYGIYKGSPSEKTVLADAEAAYDYLINQLEVPEKDILVAGRSLGSGPATHLASTRNPGFLILISPFKSIKAVVKQSFGNLAQRFIKERFNNVQALPAVKCPVFILHGKSDTMISYNQSLELFNIIKGNKKLHLSEDMDHTSFDFFNDLVVPLKVFFEDLETMSKRNKPKKYVPVEILRDIR